VAHIIRRARNRVLLTLIGLAAILVLAGASWIVVRFSNPAPVSLPPQCGGPIFLAHRSNSVQAARTALRHGFCGIEVDVRWRDGFGLVVAHDALAESWSPAGSLSLPGLLDSIPQRPDLIWLDFKNLAADNAAPAATYLNELLVRHGLHGHVIVEARKPWGLWLFQRRIAGVLPAYWIPDYPAGLRGIAFDGRLSMIVGLLGFSALSVPKWRLTREFANRFRRFALFTWTCNTPEEIHAAIDRGARIILTDLVSVPTYRRSQ
jgi:glycerophosphoryl diester phosphodiesterase